MSTSSDPGPTAAASTSMPDAIIHRRCSLGSVADLIEMSRGLLNGLADSQNVRSYHRFYIPKKAGVNREIHAPRETLKEVQRRLARVLSLLYEPPECSFGFIARRNTVQNVKVHARARWVLNVDLENFFPSIHFGRVMGTLCAAPYRFPREAAIRFAALCCHNQALPQGAPTSPVIANMLAQSLDRKLQNFAALHRCRYTRYADDITFSSLRRRFPNALVVRDQAHKLRVTDRLQALVHEAGFRLNERKTRLLHYRSCWRECLFANSLAGRDGPCLGSAAIRLARYPRFASNRCRRCTVGRV